jgi:hypothetical protein
VSDHSPEPWRIDEQNRVTDATGHIVMFGELDCIEAGDPRRIVACVNACAGIPTEALERGGNITAILAAALGTEAFEALRTTWRFR